MKIFRQLGSVISRNDLIVIFVIANDRVGISVILEIDGLETGRVELTLTEDGLGKLDHCKTKSNHGETVEESVRIDLRLFVITIGFEDLSDEAESLLSIVSV